MENLYLIISGELEVDAVLDRYREALEISPLAASTRRMYVSQARGLLAWLVLQESLPFADDPRLAWEWAVREYRGYLKAEHKAPASVNTALSAFNDFGERVLGLPPLHVSYESLPQRSPRALDAADQRRLLLALQDAKARDRAIVLLGLLAGLRVSEISALNATDVALSAKLGAVKIWHGKGDKFREVPLHPALRKALSVWLKTRESASDALFLGRDGERLGARSIGVMIAKLGRRAGIEGLTAHVLRHTFATQLIRAGTDTVLVAELMGHSSLDTTRRYSLPSAEDRAKAVEALSLDW